MPFFKADAETIGTTNERIFLPDASDEDWQLLLRAVGTERFVADQILIRSGDPGDCFFILAKGRVQVEMQAFFGVKVIATINAGSVFGEIAFLDGGVRTASVRALTDGEILRVSRESFVAIQAWEPQLAQRIALDLGRLCATRLRRALSTPGR